MDSTTDTSFPVRSLNTFDNAAYQAERRQARRRQMEQMQQAFESANDVTVEFDDSVSIGTAQTAPASFLRGPGSASQKKARDLVTHLYGQHDDTSPSSSTHSRGLLSGSSHHRRHGHFAEETVNLAPHGSDAEEALPNESLMEDVEIQGSSSSGTRFKGHDDKHKSPVMDGDCCVNCGYGIRRGCGGCVDRTVACYSGRSRTQRVAIVAALVLLIPALLVIVGVVVGTKNNGGDHGSGSSTSSAAGTASGIAGVPVISRTVQNRARHDAIVNRILNADVLSSKKDLETFGTAPNLALRWLTDYDEARLDTDHLALLQRYALAVLFFGTHKQQQVLQDDAYLFTTEWNNEEHWMTEKGICIWQGISCPPVKEGGKQVTSYNDNTAVLHLRLPQNNLIGNLPSELVALEDLKLLDLSQNLLKGSIPTRVGQLKELVNLHLHENKLTGFLPSELGELRELQNLHFGNNLLEGPVPTQISLLKNLESLGLNQNYFSGTLPDVSKFEQMLELYLDNNAFSGTIPEEVESLVSLVDLRMGQNHLVGTLPSTIFKMSRLELLYLGDNDLTGEVPDLFDETHRLKEVHLYQNRLSGTIPQSIGDLAVLEILYLDHNRFAGSLPESLGNLDDLTTLYAFRNRLNGNIPSTIEKMKNLRDLRLYQNQIEGGIPPVISSAFNLEILFVHDNKLSGTIPTAMGELDRLEAFRFYRNEITGSMPQQVCDLRVKELEFMAGDCDEEDGIMTCDCCHECFP